VKRLGVVVVLAALVATGCDEAMPAAPCLTPAPIGGPVIQPVSAAFDR
jgi:hypothetical protein